MTVPDRIERLSAKRGIEWTPDEVQLYKEWLCERQQLQTAWNFAACYLGSGTTEQDVEDAVSDLYSLFEQARRSYRPDGPKPCFYNYLVYVCFKRKCVLAGNRVRRRRSREISLEQFGLDNQTLEVELADDSITGDSDRLAQNQAFLGDLNAFVNSDLLPDKQKHVFTLRYIEGLSYDDIAQTTGFPMGSVKVWLKRATTRARLYFEERGWSECHRQE